MEAKMMIIVQDMIQDPKLSSIAFKVFGATDDLVATQVKVRRTRVGASSIHQGNTYVRVRANPFCNHPVLVHTLFF